MQRQPSAIEQTLFEKLEMPLETCLMLAKTCPDDFQMPDKIIDLLIEILLTVNSGEAYESFLETTKINKHLDVFRVVLIILSLRCRDINTRDLQRSIERLNLAIERANQLETELGLFHRELMEIRNTLNDLSHLLQTTKNGWHGARQRLQSQTSELLDLVQSHFGYAD